MSWLLLIVLYTGEIKQVSYDTPEKCEIALMNETDNGKMKHISIAECIREDIQIKR
jgi:hypothetical protein